MTALLEAVVPRSALTWGPGRSDRIARVLYELTIEGPPPAPVVFGPNYEVLDVDPTTLTDEERDEHLVIYPEWPDLADVLRLVEHELRPEKSVPGPLNLRRWRSYRRVVSALSTLGVIRSMWYGTDVNGSIVGGVRFGRGYYLLGRPRWWWDCQRRQGWRLRGRHRPARPFILGTCAACTPCPTCGALYECENPERCS